jgi:hypothetical protein
VIYLPLGLWLVPARRNAEGARILVATGISLGPLLMILIDPFVHLAGLHGIQLLSGVHLLNIVIAEDRATLWWAALVATIYLLKELF